MTACRAIVVALLFWFAAHAHAKDAAASCAKTEAELTKVKAQLKAAKARATELEQRVQSAQAGPGGPELSFTALASSVRALTGALASHVLDKTDVDDQLLDAASRHLGNARDTCSAAVDKISSTDYAELLSSVKRHPTYVANVAPVVEKASKAAEPHMKQYVYPAMSQGRTYADQAKKQVEPHMKKVTGLFEEHALPVWQKREILAGHVRAGIHEVDAKLARVLQPVFTFVHTAAPGHASALPQGGWDRVVICIGTLVALYYGAIFSVFLFAKSFALARMCMRIAFLPVRLALRLVAIALWFATCFHCCGLCGPRRGSSAMSGKDGGKKKTPPTNGKNSKAAPLKATLEDVVALVEVIKQKGNLGEKSVKLLMERAEKGLILEGKNYPARVQGKTLDKDVLKKALNKFNKDVDMKKLGL